MIRVNIVNNLNKNDKQVVDTKHFLSKETKIAREWAERNISYENGLFATLWYCEDENSYSQEMIDIIIPKKK